MCIDTYMACEISIDAKGEEMKFRYPIRLKNKTYKQPYSKSKRFARSCRNHGSCGYCENTRLYKRNLIEEAMELEIRDYYKESECD